MIRIQPQVVLWPGQAAGGRPQRRRQRSGLSHGNHCQCDRQAAAAAVRRWHPLAVAAAGAAAAASGGSSLGLLSNQLGVTASPCVNLKGVKMMATRLQVQLLRFPVNHALWQVTSTEKNSHGWLCECCRAVTGPGPAAAGPAGTRAWDRQLMRNGKRDVHDPTRRTPWTILSNFNR
jgi:hypothetical protein